MNQKIELINGIVNLIDKYFLINIWVIIIILKRKSMDTIWDIYKSLPIVIVISCLMSLMKINYKNLVFMVFRIKLLMEQNEKLGLISGPLAQILLVSQNIYYQH